MNHTPTCRICGAPISKSAARGLCQRCGVRESWDRRRQNGTANKHVTAAAKSFHFGSLHSANGADAELASDVRLNTETYGLNRKCVDCPRKCKTYAAPNSRIVYCPKRWNIADGIKEAHRESCHQ